MKNLFKQTLTLLAISAGILWGCDKDDSATYFGFTKIFMPQALNSGGIDRNYVVPQGLGPETYNFKIDQQNSKIQVVLGVLRAGTHKAEPFIVDVITRPDTVNQILAMGLPDDSAELMHADVYQLPEQVSVANGNVESTFYMDLDVGKLRGYSGKKLVMAVALTNPSRYKINASVSTTVVIVDVDELLSIVDSQ